MKYLLFVILFATSAHAGWFGPSNYDECIIESMKGVQSNIAARLIQKSCREKFPKNNNSSKTVMIPASSLTGNAWIVTNSVSGNIYNRTDSWTVTSIVISLRNNLPGMQLKYEKYKINVNLEPYSNSDFRVSTNWAKGADDSWSIEEAYGYKTK